MKIFRKAKRFIAAMTATVVTLASLSSIANAWGGDWGFDGTIAMAPADSNIQLYTDYNGARYHANAKAVVDGSGHYIPVYCIEQGRHLENGEGANRELYYNDSVVTVGAMAGHTVRDAVGIIYTVGYNGYNDWGVYDINIYGSGASLSNGNYVKYVATQALIWEAVNNQTFHHSPDPNDSVQQAINELRARLHDYENRNDRVSWNAGDITLYDNPTDALNNPNHQTSVAWDGVDYQFHFDYNYSGEYNPSNYNNSSSNTSYITSRNDSDFTVTQESYGHKVLMSWDINWGSSTEAISGGYYYLDDNDANTGYGVQLWRPSGAADDQLCISATATREIRYAAFEAVDDRFEYSASASLNTVKVDDQGNLASGATFTVYNSDGSVFGTMSDSADRGHYSIDIPNSVFEDERGVYYDEDLAGNPITTPIECSFTIVETSPATSVNLNGSWVDATFADNSSTTYSVTVSLDRQTGEMTWTASGSNGGTAARNAARDTTHADISFGTSGGNTVNVPYVTADYSFQIAKVDDQSRSARGAEFTVYSDSACANEIGTMTDSGNNGIYSFSGSFSNQLRTATASQTVTLYVKETVAADQILNGNDWEDVTCALDGTVHTVVFTWNPATGEMTGTIDADHSVSSTRAANTLSSDISADWTAYPIVNVPYVSADYEFEIAKIDDMDRSARGAEFTVYSDSACTNEIGTMTDTSNDGIYSFSGSFADDLRSNADDQTLTLYVRETVAADQILYDGSWIDVECELDDTVYTVVITWNPSTGAMSATWEGDREVTSSRDDSSLSSSITADWTDEPVVNVVLTSGSLTIEKQDDQTGEALTGAVFGVYVDADLSGTYDPTIDTPYAQLRDPDGDGKYTMTDMPIQGYIVRELIAPDGYEIDPNTYAFEIVPGNLDVVIDNVQYTVLDTSAGIFVDGNAITGTEFLSINESSHMTVYAEEATFVDHVSYNGLIVGQTYESVAIVYDKATGEPLTDTNGNIITNTVIFTATETTGVIEVPLTINTIAWESGKTIVCFEDLYRETANGRVHVGVHHDLNDENQTITPPSGSTTFMGTATGDHVVPVGTTTSLTDVVSYEGLEVGRAYTVTGTIMVKNGSEGTELTDANGNVVTATTTFTATTSTGTVDVVFTDVDTTSLVGKELVAFESIKTSGFTVWIHADLNDDNQTVRVPNMGTSATGSDGSTKTIGAVVEATILDAVNYEGLTPGQQYVVYGSVNVVTTNADGSVTATSLRINDQEVTASATFTPTESAGTVVVTFTFDGSGLTDGTKLVVYEELYMKTITTGDNGESTTETYITEHKDASDSSQTVTITSVPKTGDARTAVGYIVAATVAIGVIGSAVIALKKTKTDETAETN
ncbi:MAG: VaFE repeat-containing surface-anchored protein [Saccharofermentans sp.]|nr:VaFE repeat-containing surface-anchored protein [Saccharofermentans sp.]